ncbi:transporter [Thalassorhabdomicrobium marinisediminis]|uniref:Transporter n=2 Tax=Thalassorhabdomicrobium marinisediminis TaxID=2170577 RepID=A0A2T7FVH8_9RHOB|nr:transporter [Thalassorhabdomicrobium marinisediminis]
MALKQQLTEQFSLSMIYDQPFGAVVDYAEPGYALDGVNAEVETDGVTILGRYEINPNFSVHGGLRYVQAKGVYDIVAYESNYDTDGDFGYVLGGAYERDDIALRVALTYSSAIDLELDGDVGGNTLTANLPESVNLNFQTGIAADTLVFGSVRYVAWDGFRLVDSNDPTGEGNILAYDDDVITYNLGIGRRFTDNFSATIGVGYEKSTGETTGQLGPTDGFISYQVGGAYTMDNGIEISGGIRYIDIGDADTNPIAPAPFGQTYEDNDAIAIGLKVAYAY